MSVLPSTVNGTELGSQEWRDALFLRCVIYPPDLPEHYNGCGAAFEICHALDCNNGCLVTARHNKLCDGISDLASKAFTPRHLRDDPKVCTGSAMHGGKYNLKGPPSQDVVELK